MNLETIREGEKVFSRKGASGEKNWSAAGAGFVGWKGGGSTKTKCSKKIIMRGGGLSQRLRAFLWFVLAVLRHGLSIMLPWLSWSSMRRPDCL